MTIFFPDLSHYKTPLLNGAVALITKATQGTSFVDSTYVGFQQSASKLRIPFAGYHWIDTSDLGAQASNAFRVMGSVPCMWDAEAAGASVARIVDLTKRYRALGGNPRMVYLPHWWWQDHLGSPSLQPLVDLGLALVSSAYPAAGYSENGIGWNSYGGASPTVWQYTDKQPFNGWNVDFNAFKGTVEQLRRLWGFVPTGDDDVKSYFGRIKDGPRAGMLFKSLDGVVVSVYGSETACKAAMEGDGKVYGRWDCEPTEVEFADGRWGTIPAGMSDAQLAQVAAAAAQGAEAGAPTREELVDAAEEGANLAEDS